MQIYFILKLAIANNIQQEKNNLNTHYLGLLNEHYKYINKLDSDTRKFRHDIKNHILIIKKLLNQNSLDELNKYTSEVFGKLENMTANIYTNNPVIDAIINQYAYMCKNHDISLSVSGFLPDTCHIEAFDLCTIFSNILQNAYEAAQKVSFSDRFITITIRYDNDIIILHQENSFLNENTSLHKKTGLPITTKEDSENHGFGLSNINDCLKKNRGTMSIKISEKIFIMDILIFNY